jgi:hypothetical protein
VRIYPNPSHDLCIIDVPEATGAIDLQLINAQGGTALMQRFASTAKINLDLSDLAAGPYTLLLRTAAGEKAVRRVVKE